MKMHSELSKTRYKIRASSTLMMRMSPVFKSMLGPHFQEGQQLHATPTAGIHLPDDNPTAIMVLFNILHLAEIPDQVSTRALVDVAKLADKYLCTEKIKFFAQAWSDRLKDKKSCWELGRLLTACYHLNFAQHFAELSSRVVMSSGTSTGMRTDICGDFTTYVVDMDDQDGFAETFGKPYGLEMPFQASRLTNITELLQQYEEDRFSSIKRSIEKTVEDLLYARERGHGYKCLPECRVPEEAAVKLIKQLRAAHLDVATLGTSSLQNTLKALGQIPEFPFGKSRDGIKPCSDQCIFHKLKDMRQGSFKDIAEKETPPPKLLCLEGFRLEGGWNRFCGIKYCRHCAKKGVHFGIS